MCSLAGFKKKTHGLFPVYSHFAVRSACRIQRGRFENVRGPEASDPDPADGVGLAGASTSIRSPLEPRPSESKTEATIDCCGFSRRRGAGAEAVLPEVAAAGGLGAAGLAGALPLLAEDRVAIASATIGAERACASSCSAVR